MHLRNSRAGLSLFVFRALSGSAVSNKKQWEKKKKSHLKKRNLRLSGRAKVWLYGLV